MDESLYCPRCGGGLVRRAEDGTVCCPRCRVAWEAEGDGDDAAVIEVFATPIPPGETIPVPERVIPRPGRRPEIHVRRFEVQHYGGGGCCFGGCLVVAILVYLVFRGLMSLF